MTRDLVTEIAPSRIETEAKRLYVEMTDNHPSIHANRFPSWAELEPVARAEWYAMARSLTEPATPARPLRTKPLDWQCPNGCWYADTILGRYSVWGEYLCLPGDYSGRYKFGKSIEQLKAMAQEHFTAAIAAVVEEDAEPTLPVADAKEAGRFHALMQGQDAAAVWRGRAERLGAAMDTLRAGIEDLKKTLDETE